MVPIQEISTNTGKQYSLKNSISNGFKLFTTIKKRIIVKLSSWKAGKKVSEYPRGAK